MSCAAAEGLGADRVDFARDVQPILHARCVSCHGSENPQGGLSLFTRSQLLKGGLSGPAIVPGSGEQSLIVQRVSGGKSPRMPLNGKPLGEQEIAALAKWIDEGAQWDPALPLSKSPAPLAVRRPKVPSGPFANPIDAFVDARFRARGVAFPDPVSDAVFLRRAYLDLWGLLPTPRQRQEFLGDARPGKRELLIDQLLAHRGNYAEHWISYWNDLLHNDEGVSYPAGQRESITEWLLQALRGNMPYHRMVESLLNPVGEGAPKGFLIGVNWGGDASASQSPPMQAAQNSAQLFLGINLKCASCHDSFVSRWKLAQAFNLAAYFSATPLEIVRCDVKTGKQATPGFLFSELDEGEPAIELEARRAQAARMFTSSRNGRFPRTWVNRMWKQLLGRGLVEPADEMDSEPWSADLLDWLASDFADHGYDTQLLLRRIMTSRAYQTPAVNTAGTAKDYTFRGPLHRRLTAEQFTDALSAITGEWKILDDRKGNPGVSARQWRFKSDPLTRALGRPDRNQVFTERSTEATTLQALELVNGEGMAELLHRGARRMLGELRPPPPNLFDSGVVTSGKAVIDIDIRDAKRLWLLTVDAGSYGRSQVTAGWLDAEFEAPQGKVRLIDLPTPDGARKESIRIKEDREREGLAVSSSSTLVYDIAGKEYTRLRAVAGLDESSLRYEINAKVRFFVFAEEPDPHQLVRVQGEPPVQRLAENLRGDKLVESVYLHALSRNPTPIELKEGTEMLEQYGAGGLEDLLWIILLSPEFQFVR